MNLRGKSLADLNSRPNPDWCSGEDTSPRHSSLAAVRDYDTGYRRQKADRLYYVKALLFLSMVYIAWVAFHESLHYAACAFPGNRAYVASVVPTPAIACVRGGPVTPYGAFVYYMSPYIAAVLVLALFARSGSGMTRLVPYTAFFDMQYNLLATSLLGGELNGVENDVVSLIQHTQEAGPFPGAYGWLCVVAVAFLIGLSLMVFYCGYRDDLSRSEYRGLFAASFLFYTLFYASGTILLYL